jgi:two-component system, LytTR family, response regulator
MDRNIRTLIVDDEPLAREGIRLLLAADSQFEIVGECTNGKEAITAIRKGRPHLVFLDVQMPEVDGLGVLRALSPEQLPLVVFVTAFDKFAIAAFDAHALDYVLKPVNPERFATTLTRVKKRFAEQEVSQISQRLIELLQSGDTAPAKNVSESRYITRFSVKTGDRIQFVEVADVDWLGAEDYYVNLHVGKQSHLIRETLSNLEQQLDPAKFIRIHRSTIVNSARIKELKQHFRGEYLVILYDGTSLKLGRTYHEAATRLLSGR